MDRMRVATWTVGALVAAAVAARATGFLPWPSTDRQWYVLLIGAGLAWSVASYLRSRPRDREHARIAGLAAAKDWDGVLAVGLAVPAPDEHPPRRQAGSHLLVAQAGLLTSALQTGLDHIAAARHILGDAAGDDRVGRHLATWTALALAGLGRFDEFHETAGDAVATDRGLRFTAAAVAIEQRDLERAEQLLAPGPPWRDVSGPWDEHPDPGRLRLSGSLLLEQGRPDEGTALLRRAVEVYERRGEDVDAAYARSELANHELTDGRPERAMALLVAARGHAAGPNGDSRQGIVLVAAGTARAAAALGRLDTARDAAVEATAAATWTGAPPLLAMAHRARAAVAAAEGDRDVAATELRAGLSLIEHLGDTVDARAMRADLDALDGPADGLSRPRPPG